nr:MAG TPA: hypothetical protein [Bacteriophage sp.]
MAPFTATRIVSLDHWLAYLSHYSTCTLYCGTDLNWLLLEIRVRLLIWILHRFLSL